MFQVCMIGSNKVGKSSLLERLTAHRFLKEYAMTQPLKNVQFAMSMAETNYTFSIDQVTSLDQIENLSKYIAFLIVFDVTDRNSFKETVKHLESLKKSLTQNQICIVLGNKIDVHDRHHKVQPNEITLARHTTFFYTSAKSNYNQEKPYYSIINFWKTCK